MSYRENFDEFGNLRENHSPWSVREVCGYCAALAVFVLIASGVLGP